MRVTRSFVFTSLFVLAVSSLYVSCRKTDGYGLKPAIDVTERFFTLPSGTNPLVRALSQTIFRQQQQKPFVHNFVKWAGYPLWDKAVVSGRQTSTASSRTTAGGDSSEMVLLPFAKAGESKTSAIVVALLTGRDTVLHTIYQNQYKNLPYQTDTSTRPTAEQMALLFMSFDKHVYGNKLFYIKDTSLFGFATPGKPNRFVDVTNNLTLARLTALICYEVMPTPQNCVPEPVTSPSTTPGACLPQPVGFRDGARQECIEITYGGPGGGGESGGPFGWGPGDGSPGGGGGTTGGGDGTPGGEWTYNPCTSANNGRNPCDNDDGNNPPWIPVTITLPPFDPNDPFAYLNHPVDVADEPLINNGIGVADVPAGSPQGAPRQIGRTTNRGNTEDMQHGTNGNSTGISPRLLLSRSDNGLFTDMSSLFYWCTVFDNQLKNTGDLMIQKFRDKTGGTFENPTLNEKVKESHNFINFLKRFGIRLQTQLSANGGNIDNISLIDMGDVRPVFNGAHNKFHGLQILINDTEYTEIQLDNFELSPTGTWEADVTVTIHDHFGLDKHDALAFQAWDPGFPAWWILQHMRNYIPFETIVKVKKRISGAL